MISQCLLLFAQVLLFSFSSVWSQHLENDLVLLHDIDVNYKLPRPTSSDDDFEVEYDNPPPHLRGIDNDGIVMRHWGVPDSQAEVGKLFSLVIPNDTFTGTFDEYEFLNLPSFLSWDKPRITLTGVPLPKDIGHHYIYILAMVRGFDEPRAKEKFLVEVFPSPDLRLIEESKCRSEEVTVLTIVTAADSSKVSGIQRSALIHKFSKAFTIDTQMITLMPVPKNYDALSDDSAILAGAGDASLNDLSLSSQPSSDPIQLSWPLGCDGDIAKENNAVIEKLRDMVKKGLLSKEFGVPVLGWHVTQTSSSHSRPKRELYDYDYSGDDYDDYSDYDEHFKFPEERIIPSLASPVFTDPPHTDYNGQPARPQYVSPVFKPVPMSTPVYVPVKPTVLVEPSPTLPDTHHTNQGGFGDYELESSLLTHPSTMVGHTTPLTNTATLSVNPTTYPRLPIEPSVVPETGYTTEYDMKNFAPSVDKRIPKLPWASGYAYRMRIPEDAFSDIEDGKTRNLTLELRNEKDEPFDRDSWIQFNRQEQEVYSLPLENNIGKYDFKLYAKDKGGKNITDLLKISVRQPKDARNFNHYFMAVLKVEKKHHFDNNLAWQIRFLEKLAHFFGDEDISHINVRNISHDPIHITWTNTSLVDSSLRDCPSDELLRISQKLMHHSNELTRDSKEAFLPEFKLKRINVHYFYPCEHLNSHHHGIDTIGAPGTLPDEEHKRQNMKEHENNKPIFRNQIDMLSATEGVLFRERVASDACYDMEDGDTTSLSLNLLTDELTSPPRSSWLQFDPINQEFYGLPLKNDIGKKDYVLVCTDKGNLRVTDSLIIRVLESPYKSQPPVKFSITINMDYNTFKSDSTMRVELVEKIGRVFGDHDPDNVVVESIVKGSVVVTWHNKSLTSEPCPHDEIRRLRETMIDEKGLLTEDFKNSFGRFNVTEGLLFPYGDCLSTRTPTYTEEPDIGTPEEKQIDTSEEDYLLTFIIPAVVIAIMLLLAAVIACCLYRRRRYGKMSMADDRTFVSKGIPIIFAEELDDQRTDNAKSPVIMKEEKPPLPPPEYQKNSPAMGFGSRSHSGQDRQRHSSNDGINSADDAPYHPPPPFTTSNGAASRNQRPNLPPAYRKPPTYVPP